jgi:putative heme-binding domain-containing protein
LDAQAPPSLRRGAIAALAGADPRHAAEVMLSGWKRHAPATRSNILATLVTRADGAQALLDALEIRRLAPADFDSATRRTLETHGDEAVRSRAKALLGSVETARGEVVERFRAAIDNLPGDAGAGRLVFEEICAVCHQLQGIGTEVGPNLAALTDRSPAAMLAAILDPNRAYESQYAEYAVALKDGRVLSGLIAAETANSITLRRQEGKEDVILRGDIDELSSAGRSFMPEGLEKDLSPADVADVIAFLNATSSPPKTFEGNKPSVVRAGDDGTIRLPATAAEIYGSSLVFEPRHENLGYWSSADDRAAWTFEAAEAGVYEIFTDYAAASDVSGNHFDVRVGELSVEGIATSTGTWNDYRRRQRVGEITLAKGRNRLEVVPHGTIRGALMDLRAVILVPRQE